MAFVLPDWVWETTTTTGTGAYTLGGAVTNYRPFSSQLSNGDTCYYSCWDGTNFEEGVGTYTSAGNTLTRTTIYRSTNANAAVNWTAGTRQIMAAALGVTMQSLMTPGSTGFPNRSADNTWGYYNTSGTGTTVALTTSPTFTTAWGMNSDVSFQYETSGTVGWHTTTSDAHTTGNGLVQNIYTFFTDASNYERWQVSAAYNSGALRIFPQAAGTYSSNTRGLFLQATDTVNIGSLNNLGVTIQAGGSSGAPLKITSGTLMTTPAAGSVEYDGTVFYKTNNASNRGLSPASQYAIFNNTTYTLTSTTSAQKLFNTSTNGAITLPTGIFEFECYHYLTNLSSTSGTISFGLVVGTATFTTFFTVNLTRSLVGSTSTLISQSFNATGVTASGSSGTATGATVFVKGTIRVTVAGTIIPSVAMSQASAAVVNSGSYFKVTQIANTSNQTIGNWS